MSDRPSLRMRVQQGGGLRPADEYSEHKMMRYAVGREIEIKPSPNLTSPKRRRYFAILDAAYESGATTWKSADEGHEIMKGLCLGMVVTYLPNGKPYTYARSTTDLEDPDFDDFYEAAMAWLWKITGVDPDTLLPPREDHQRHSQSSVVQGVPRTPAGEEGDGGPHAPHPAAVADEPVSIFAPSNEVEKTNMDERSFLMDPDEAPVTTPSLKQEAIDKVLKLANDVSLDRQARTEELAKLRPTWDAALKGHPQFVHHCFTTAAKVVRGEITKSMAQKFLYSMRDG
jgi:hypothetical protein